MTERKNYRQVVIIGAGPAGLFAARKLVEEGVRVVLLNRDIKPGGLAEYGIYFEKYKIKNGLRKQFRQIMALPEITYFGNVTVGDHSDISIEELKSYGFDAILVAAGAQGTKKLGLPGEDLTGVYHGKDIVYHYNKLPPYSTKEFLIKRKVAIVGVGNVMMDIAHWAARTLKVDEIVAVARRGPAEVKFTDKEIAYVFNNLDRPAFENELARCTPYMKAVGQDPAKAQNFILAAASIAQEADSQTRIRFSFLSSPTQIIGNDKGEVVGLEVEENQLIRNGDETKAVGLGTKRIIAVDSVIFCIGDMVDPDFGLPVQSGEFVKNPAPSFPIDGISYEVFDPQNKQPVKGTFVVGWSRLSSTGLVGLARRDSENGVKAMLEYLRTTGINEKNDPLTHLEQRLQKNHKQIVHKEDVLRLEAEEEKQKQKLGLEDFKFETNEDMLKAIQL